MVTGTGADLRKTTPWPLRGDARSTLCRLRSGVNSPFAYPRTGGQVEKSPVAHRTAAVAAPILVTTRQSRGARFASVDRFGAGCVASGELTLGLVGDMVALGTDDRVDFA